MDKLFFMWILESFKEHLFCRKSADSYFWIRYRVYVFLSESPFRPHVVDLLFIVIYYAKSSMWFVLIIWLFFEICQICICYFFQKQVSKDHLTQGSFLKTMLLNERQSNLEKETYGNISLYSKYFSPWAGSNVHKTENEVCTNKIKWNLRKLTHILFRM